VVAGVLVITVLLALGSTGCSHNRTFTRGSMPEWLHARPVHNPRTLDLSPFAGPPIDMKAIDCGDELSVSVVAGLSEEDKVAFPVRVGDDGVGVLPEIGPVPLAGLHPMVAEQQIIQVAKQRDVYRQPTVNVAIEKRRTNRVRVIGAVNRALVVGGIRQEILHDLPWRSSYLKAAIDAGGGLSEDAGTRVSIWRPSAPAGESQVVELDLLDPNDRSRGSPYLTDGSVVNVEQRPPRAVQVEGEVVKRGPVEYSVVHGLRLSEAVGMAGGTSNKLADAVVVTRGSPDGLQRGDIKLNLDNDADKNFELMPGDIVRVKQTPATWVLDVFETVVRVTVGSNVAFP